MVEDKIEDDRLSLWAHLVSEHAGIYSLRLTMEELTDIHEHEHDGPGTIGCHPRSSRKAAYVRMAEVLKDGDDCEDMEIP